MREARPLCAYALESIIQSLFVDSTKIFMEFMRFFILIAKSLAQRSG